MTDFDPPLNPPPCSAARPPLSPQQTESLRRSDALFRAVFDNAAIGVTVRDADGHLLLTNPAFQRMHGYGPEDLMPLSFVEMTHPEDVARDWELYAQLVAGTRENYQIRKRNLRRDGQILHVDLSVSRTLDQDTGRVYGIAIVRDVTERAEAEEAERAAHRQTAEILESIGDAFYAVDHEWRFLYVNRRAEEWWDISRADLIGKNLWEVFPQAVGSHPYQEHLRAAKDRVAAAFETVSPVLTTPISISIYPSATGLCVYFRDIAEQRKAEWERDYVLAGANCLLWYADVRETGEQYLWWQKSISDLDAARRFLPVEVRPGEDFEAASYRSRHPEDRDRCDALGTASIRAGKSYEQEFRVICADGSERWIHENVRIETVVEGQHWRAVGLCTDITAQKRYVAEIEELNARLRDAMTETHHRVKNNLQVVSALIDLQVLSEDETIPASELRRVSQHVRALAYVHDMLTDAAKASGDVVCLSMAELFARLMPHLQAVVGGRKVRYEADDVRVPARQGTALAVLVNELVSNAVKHGSGDVDVRLTLNDGTASLSVSDGGPGFPEGFDPEAHAHTGLELVDNLSRWDLGGSVEFDNLPHGGACVTVRFPSKPGPAEEPPQT